MPIKRNGFYNNPAMAQAAANLSSMFEPPSGSDEAGYARARADNLQTGQREALWKYMQDPNADPNLISMGGIISDLYDWTGSKYGVDTGAATQRYGYDKTAETSLANNAADNVRALQLGREQALMQPIGENETQFRPPSIVDLFDVPASQTGVVGASQGEKLVLPDGTVVEGAAKPLSETEWMAQQLEEAKGKNEISTGDVADTLIGKETPVMVIMPDGKISYMTPGEAARTGATPVLSSEQQKGQIIDRMTPEQQIQSILGTETVETMGPTGAVITPRAEAAGMKPVPKASENKLQGLDSYVRADGTSFVGYADDSGKIHNQSGALEPTAVRKGELPASTQGALGKPTDKQLTSAFAAKMSEESVKRLLAAYDDPALMPSASDMTVWPTFNQMERSESIGTATIGRFLKDSTMSDAGKEFFLNLTNILPYELMQKSGAATTQTDWATSLASAVPQPNDTPTMRLIRRERLLTFLKATYGMATGERVVDPAAAATAEAPPAAAEPAASAPAAASGTEVARPTTDAEFNALPAGAAYIDPDDPKNPDGTPKIYTK
jgi:hypothetical protein